MSWKKMIGFNYEKRKKHLEITIESMPFLNEKKYQMLSWSFHNKMNLLVLKYYNKYRQNKCLSLL